jgi:hypothetical protein
MMKQPLALMSSLWKTLGVSLLLAVMPASAVVAFAEPAEADALRQQAVAQYIDGATRELDVYRQQISAAVHSANQQQWAEAKAKLDECDRLVSGLKSADPEQFDRIKASYERTRGEMVKSLRAAQET